jgi:hypothetical protein
MDSFELKNRLERIVEKPRVQLSHRVLDDELLVNLDYFAQRKWEFRLHDEYKINWLDVDLFVRGLTQVGICRVETFMFTGGTFEYLQSLEAKYSAIKNVFFNAGATDPFWEDADVITSSLIITTHNIDFVVIIDEYREMFYFFGDRELIERAIPVSWEAYRDYYESLYEMYKYEPLPINYLDWLWDNYIAPSHGEQKWKSNAIQRV